MNVSINYWAVLLAGISSMIIGSVYYAPSLFGKAWMKLAKIDEKRFRKEMPRIMLGVFVAALVVAYVLARFVFIVHSFYGHSYMYDAVMTSLWVWLGFTATTLFVHNALDQRPKELTFISVGNRLFTLLAMGLIIGWLHP